MVSMQEESDPQGVYTLGNLTLNLDNYRLAIGEEVVDLTFLELELLRLLVLKPNAVIRYDDMTRMLWQRTNRASTRHLNVLIHRLRAKLAGSYPYAIETVRGRGYGLLRSRETEFAFAHSGASVESPVPFAEASRRTEARQ
jgi:DNA-binding response OmpR family regulator